MGPRLFSRLSGRSLVGWTLVGFVVLQLAAGVALEIRHPEAYDPEFRDRLMLLRRRHAEGPGRPLLLVVGSSRITTDFRPEVLPPLRTAAGEAALPFNLSHSGGGPLQNLVAARRLRREGLRPAWMVIEVVPPLLGASGQSTAVETAEAHDLATLRHYVRPAKLYGGYLLERLAASFNHRRAVLRDGLSLVRPRGEQWDSLPLDPLGGTTGWLEGQTGPRDIAARTEATRRQYYPGLQRFRLADGPVRALRELLSSCRHHHIPTVLLLAPESTAFRSWYPDRVLREVLEHCRSLGAEFGSRLVDARDWLGDDSFIDGQHAFPAAAEAFTRRLGREVLQPLVQQRR